MQRHLDSNTEQRLCLLSDRMPEPHPIRTGNTEPSAGTAWFKLVLAHLKKDLQIEFRSREAINSMLFFALLVVVLFSIAFDPTRESSREIAGGVLCVATLFASVSALNQAWAREIRHQVLDALRMTPSGGAAMFLAKVLANFMFVSIVQFVLGPIFFIFYNLHPLGNVWMLLAVVPLGTWALVVNGTFFAALSIRSRNRELLLPLILFPDFSTRVAGDGAFCEDHSERRQQRS